MSATDIVLQPTSVGLAQSIEQALQLVSMPGDIYEAAVSLGLDAAVGIDEKRITLGILTGGIDRVYGSGWVEKFSQSLGGSPSASSLYMWEAWLRCMGVETAALLLSHGVLYSHQRNALWKFKDIKDLAEKRAAALDYLSNPPALPEATGGKPGKPRKIVEAHKAKILGVHNGRVVVGMGAPLAIELKAGDVCHVVFWQPKEL